MKLAFLIPTAFALACGGLVLADDAKKDDAKPAAAKAEAKAEVSVPFHGNAECPMSGEKIKTGKFAEKDGKRIYVCCSKCERAANKDFDTAYAKAYPADKVVDLANELCPVSGDKVKADVSVAFQGHKVHFCCQKCAAKWQEGGQKNLALALDPKLVAANNAKCPVMPDDECDGTEFFVYKDTLIDVCCGDCIEKFQETPDQFLKAANIDIDALHEKARAAKAAQPAAGGR